MTDIPPPSGAADDPVDRAAAALRRDFIPEGPPDETIARTLSALRAADESITIPISRRLPLRYAWKIALAGLLAASVAVYFTGLLPPRPPLAFAEVAAKLRDARTLTYEITYESPEQKEPAKTRVFYKEPGWARTEDAEHVSIIDLKQCKMLLLDSAAKTALLLDYKNAGVPKKDVSLIHELRRLTDKKGESVGKKSIGDLEAEGFRVEDEGFTLTVWANPKTKMPVFIEMPIRVGDQEHLTTMSDFQLDPKLDDALFLMQPPEGYKLRTMEMEDGKLEDDVVYLLRAYADKFAGNFPKSLSVASSDWQTYLKRRRDDKKGKGLPESEAVQFAGKVLRVEKFLRTDKNHGYNPEGVKLGDSAKIIFWYRPEKSAMYRAVYGDLHVADVTADQLPGT
ncbi:MAG TPA: hypothetical protein VE999_08580 [Gemmataceae bacterium]|nr:hypothetical protein [Gemmataceae bacterium]